MDNQKTLLQLAVGSRLIKLSRIYRREIDHRLMVFGVSDATAVPVMLIGRLGGGARQVTLAEEMGVEGPSLVRLLDQLSHAGLIERRDDPTDRRAKTVHLTPAGMDLARRIDLAMVEIRQDLFAGIADADMTACVRVFDKLAQNLQKIPMQGIEERK
ncbi:MAG: MarR family transcriptional regulator [Ferrovum sp.]|nr:MarR family transcriptional regulator [Ferrovum sp.]NDU87997.1 MarR family transcriptional regulator [Ferrovum sp.]